jgi:hypothetical protein
LLSIASDSGWNVGGMTFPKNCPRLAIQPGLYMQEVHFLTSWMIGPVGMDKLRYLSLAVIAFFLINLAAGFFRKPIDLMYVPTADPTFFPPGRHWSRVDPEQSYNFAVGAYAVLTQDRDHNEVYQIRVIRYLNLFPDIVMKPHLVGHYWDKPLPPGNK